jgi:hypothetical protein
VYRTQDPWIETQASLKAQPGIQKPLLMEGILRRLMSRGHFELSFDLGQFRQLPIRVSLLPPTIAHKTGCISLNAAFCRLLFL